MRVKVCGVTRAQDARLACSLGAWAVGFVFVKDSPREVTLKEAAALRKAVKAPTMAVGVFADTPRARTLEISRACGLDALQFHGDETPEDCAGYAIPVYKAIAPGARFLDRYPVAGFLIEPRRTIQERKQKASPAVRAQRAAWTAAAELSGFKVILAGGLDAENVVAAVRKARPFAVDVSGGVERTLGVKDPRKLRAFFEALR